MRVIDIKRFVRKCTLYYSCIGAAIGVILLIVCTISGNVPFRVNETVYYGLKAGLLALVFCPIIMAIVGLFHSVLFWLPIIWIYRKITNKLKA